jgi:hypothetical protein
MGQHAAAAGPAAGEALARLDELLRCPGEPVVQRAVMYELAAAVPAAAPALLQIQEVPQEAGLAAHQAARLCPSTAQPSPLLNSVAQRARGARC